MMLEADHRRFEALLEQGEQTTERARKGRANLLSTLASALTLHELQEEKVLYPALKVHPEAKDVALEGYEEHHVADLLLEELKTVATDEEQWGAKFKVLKESLAHHIEEEENRMFPLARGLFATADLQAMAARMRKLAPAKGPSRAR
jgi:iron-sulfur cluster repair protein YtfE (RIC family)